MSDETYFYLDEKSEACGPYTAGQLRTMVAMGQLTPDTLSAVPDSPDWVPLGTLITLPPAVLASNQQSIRSQKPRSASGIAILLLGAIAIGAIGWAAVRWAPKLKKLAAKEEAPVAQPHALARWYLFGYFQARQQAKINAVFGKTSDASKADLAYTLKTLAVPDPTPQHFGICAEGYEDGLQNKPQRYVVQQKDAAPDDDFPAELQGIFDIPSQGKAAPTPAKQQPAKKK
jgi:hypothetical protein